MKIAIIGLVVIMAIGAFFGMYVIGTYNTEASLKVQYDAKLKDNNSQFDNMWKKIQQTASVTSMQKDSLKEIFNSYAAARTGTGGSQDGSLAKWVTEAVPNVDQKTFENLQNIITSSRDSWTEQQTELIDISRQYNQALAVFPSNAVLKLFGFQTLNPSIVTSTRTEDAFKTGTDDNVNLR